jgi:hypothetical protein
MVLRQYAIVSGHMFTSVLAHACLEYALGECWGSLLCSSLCVCRSQPCPHSSAVAWVCQSTSRLCIVCYSSTVVPLLHQVASDLWCVTQWLALAAGCAVGDGQHALPALPVSSTRVPSSLLHPCCTIQLMIVDFLACTALAYRYC